MPTSNILESFPGAITFTKTNANLASSATAGWMSNAYDNSANLYLDLLISLDLAQVNSAPANSQAIFLFASSWNSNAYAGTGAAAISGSEGTVTYPSVRTLPCNLPTIGTIPYTTQNVAIISTMFSVAAAFGGTLPQKIVIGMVNDSGMTLSVNNIYGVPVFRTVG